MSDATFGLSEEQQERFRDYRAVTAAPFWNDRDEVIGVLTTIGPENDGYFDGGPGRAVIRILADTVGVLLTTLGAEALD